MSSRSLRDVARVRIPLLFDTRSPLSVVPRHSADGFPRRHIDWGRFAERSSVLLFLRLPPLSSLPNLVTAFWAAVSCGPTLVPTVSPSSDHLVPTSICLPPPLRPGASLPCLPLQPGPSDSFSRSSSPSALLSPPPGSSPLGPTWVWSLCLFLAQHFLCCVEFSLVHFFL